MKETEERIGYRFRDPELLRRALTHSSYANERGWGRAGCNERLEFLGDSILGYFTAEYLYKAYPDKPEGEMTKLRAELVCEPSLARVAEGLDLGKALLLGRGEELGGGRGRPSITADAVEALLAAVYLDGGIGEAKRFVYDFILSNASEAAREGSHDYKTLLQELVQRDGGESPVYRMTGESGPDHCKVFTAEVLIGGVAAGSGSGRSKKEAEQSAAGDALEKLKKS
jgi:ribonuclease-3